MDYHPRMTIKNDYDESIDIKIAEAIYQIDKQLENALKATYQKDIGHYYDGMAGELRCCVAVASTAHRNRANSKFQLKRVWLHYGV